MKQFESFYNQHIISDIAIGQCPPIQKGEIDKKNQRKCRNITNKEKDLAIPEPSPQLNLETDKFYLVNIRTYIWIFVYTHTCLCEYVHMWMWREIILMSMSRDLFVHLFLLLPEQLASMLNFRTICLCQSVKKRTEPNTDRGINSRRIFLRYVKCKINRTERLIQCVC